MNGIECEKGKEENLKNGKSRFEVKKNKKLGTFQRIIATDNDVDVSTVVIMCFEETSRGVDNGLDFTTLLKFYSYLTSS